jgi:hypothetical protein
MRLAFSTQLLSKYVPLLHSVGLLIVVHDQERSSAKRKELFRGIQIRERADPANAAKQMILDMKVRWSSTYSMLDRGYELREVLTY